MTTFTELPVTRPDHSRLLAAVACTALALGFGAYVAIDSRDYLRLSREVHAGAKEAEVLRAFGTAPDRVYHRASAPADYYVKGYARKERPITHRVLIFLQGDLAWYVWLDANDRVEDVFAGGT